MKISLTRLVFNISVTSKENNNSVSTTEYNDHVDIRTRDSLKVPPVYDSMPTLRSMAKNMEIDYSKYLNKPFLVNTFKWNTTDAAFTNLVNLPFPDSVYVSNFLKVPFINSSLFRCKAKAIIQVIGTPQHQGILLASSEPIHKVQQGQQYINDAMNAPHSFLVANVSTCTELELPFYSNTKLLRTDADASEILLNSNYSGNQFCQLVINVLNPLVAADSGSTTLTGTVHIVFEELEFYAPFSEVTWTTQGSWEPQAAKSSPGLWSRFCGVISTALDNVALGAKKVTGDFIDIGRGALKQYTGLHNANKANVEDRRLVVARNPPNIVDHQNVLEKLDPYVGYNRVTRDTIFDTLQDEMDVSRFVSKPQYLSTFSVDVDTTTGRLLFSRPITPTQQVFRNDHLFLNANPQVMAFYSRYWSGTMKLHIQADMTNFHNCKLAIFKSYSPHRQTLSEFPSYESVQGLMVDFMEFSAGGQTQTLELPYCSQTQNLECTRDWAYNALQHGMYYVYLAQPLVTNGTVAKSINFNVYYSMGDDACFYGYSTDNVESISGNGLSKLSMLAESVGREETIKMSEFYSESNVFEAQSDTVFPVNEDVELTDKPEERTDSYVDCETHRPITSMKDIERRVSRVFYKYYKHEEPKIKSGVLYYRISDLLGITRDPQTSIYYGNASSAIGIRRLFLGMDGGVKIKLKLQGTNNAYVHYVPPGTYVDPEQSTKIAFATSPAGPNPSFTGPTNAANAYVTNSQSLRTSTNRQEASNYHVVDSRLSFIPKSQPSAAAMNSDECIFDLEIPNLNPCRFVGSSAIYDPSENVIDMVNDMGTIVVGIKTSDESVEDLKMRPILVSFDAGFTDETRMGYQVKSAALRYPELTVGPGFIISNYYNPTAGPSFAGPVRDPQSRFPFCYLG